MSSVATRTNRKKPIFPGVSRKVLPVHRWLGITLGLLIALWFASGMILSFVPFPSLAPRDRISRSEAIDLQRVSISPSAALAASGTLPVMHLRLISVVGHPRYVVSPVGRPVVSFSAETGQALPLVAENVARALAEQFSGEKILRLDGPFDYDQWTVHEQYGPYRPFYKISMADASGTCLYVSLRSGEVIQRTRRAERAWNWVGAVVHWINPTRLRGISLVEAAGDFPVLQLRELRNPREIEVTAVGGHPFLVVRDSGVFSSQLMSADDTRTLHTSVVIPDNLLLSAVRAAWSPVGTLGIQPIAACSHPSRECHRTSLQLYGYCDWSEAFEEISASRDRNAGGCVEGPAGLTQHPPSPAHAAAPRSRLICTLLGLGYFGTRWVPRTYHS
jgi:hypothetical protein